MRLLAEEASGSSSPGPLACVVYADLRAADVRDVLSRHCRYPLTRGVRQDAWFDPASTRADIPREDLLSDPAWQEGYRALAEFGLSFDLLVWPAQLPQAAAIAAETPTVPVVLEHLGLPDPARDAGLRTWRTGVAALAELPHACVKLSAFQLARQSARRTGRARCCERAPGALWPAALHGREQLSRRALGRRFQFALRTGARLPTRSVRRATC